MRKAFGMPSSSVKKMSVLINKKIKSTGEKTKLPTKLSGQKVHPQQVSINSEYNETMHCR